MDLKLAVKNIKTCIISKFYRPEAALRVRIFKFFREM